MRLEALSSRLPAFSRAAVTLLCAGGALLLGSGCSNHSYSSNVDLPFLTTPLTSSSGDEGLQKNLLPLVKGNNWQMRTATRGQRYTDTTTVSGISSVPGVPGYELTMLRNGQKWRREFYKQDPTGLYLTGMQDETSPLMTLNPPVPLVEYPFREGQSWLWHGTLTLKSTPYPATAYSRISAEEAITTSAGQFKTVRIDTIIILTANGQDIRFPSVRWLAPNVGFVRRGFADKGQPAFSETLQFNVH